jgi:drug/metabolite transporter (DMT)-like permease
MEKRQISLPNIIFMLFLITFWGSSFVVVKAILGEGLTPIAIATFRFLLAGCLQAANYGSWRAARNAIM